MFRKLHLQMTLFCSASISILFLICGCLWFHFTWENISQTNYASFLKELGTLLLHLQNQNTVSMEWLEQLQKDEHLSIMLYDNGSPLYSERLQKNSAKELSALAALAYEEACDKHQIDIFHDVSNQLISHEEFLWNTEDGSRYYVSAGMLYKGSGRLSFLILYSLAHQQQQFYRLCLIFGVSSSVILLMLCCFSYFFTGLMLTPLVKSQQQQNQFIASASHELRTPLAVMLSALEAMQKTGERQEQRRFAAIIRDAGGRMQNLIAEMLLLANADSHDLKLTFCETSLDELLLQIYESYELLAARKEISLVLSLPQKPVLPCRCDSQRIGQAVGILLDNALSYTPCGGKVVLFMPDSFVIGVADNGIGIKKEEKERIFERFYRVEASHTEKEHFGLGLCMAKELIDAHKGRIRVEDTADCPASRHFFEEKEPRGTTFLIELPHQAS
ncbi:MAG: HAMP domain-containing histidine kinase [Lachnospiraceae bacterium]|nr:HAMP domain-containing histidine kinase [Lachnospiraceae bacterium]